MPNNTLTLAEMTPCAMDLASPSVVECGEFEPDADSDTAGPLAYEKFKVMASTMLLSSISSASQSKNKNPLIRIVFV
jgi:hypothetical protein